MHRGQNLLATALRTNGSGYRCCNQGEANLEAIHESLRTCRHHVRPYGLAEATKALGESNRGNKRLNPNLYVCIDPASGHCGL